jgi:tetratricopeptide (TPR) repeat protein
MLVTLLATALLSSAVPTEISRDSVEALVRRVQAAVESGREADERRTLTARRGAVPTDRAALLALATLDRFTYHDADAERAYRALGAGDSSTTSTDDNALTAYAVLGFGLLRTQEARLTDAAPLLRRATLLLERTGHHAGAAMALTALAIVLQRTVSIDSALAVDAYALRIAPTDDSWLRTLITCNTLLVRVRKADPRVEHEARAAADAANDAGNPRAAAGCLAALAQDYERRTMIDSALATFKEVEALQRATRNLGALAGTLQWQGYVLSSLKDEYPAASALLTEALALGKRTGVLTAAAWASLNLSGLALTFGDLPASGSYARQAASMFAITGDRWGMVQARMHEGDVALLGGALPAARAAYEQVASDAAAIAPTSAVFAHGRLAFVSLMESDMSGAEHELDTAGRLAAKLRMPEWRQEDAYGRAMVALRRGRFTEAEQRLHALNQFLPPDEVFGRSDLFVRLAESRMRQGDLDGAERNLLLSNALIDRWRATLPQREMQLAVVQAKRNDWDRDLSFATIINAIARAGRTSSAFTLAEQRRSRVLLEHFARRQVLARTPTTAVAPSVLSDTAGRRLLPESTAVLAFVTGQGVEPTTVFVVSRDRVAAASADPVDDHTLDIDRFTGLVAAGDAAPELARRLGDAFLRPALDLVPKNVRRLVVIPDGPLHRLPFDALEMRDGHLVLERFAITLAPSASVAAIWWAHPPRAPAPRLIAFGDPVGITLSGANGDSTPPRLPAAAVEARAIARFAQHADVFIGKDASEAALRHANLANVGVLHFATHADVDEWSLMRSALLLAPGDGEDGRLAVDELVRMRVGANLVVLSACSSAGGTVLAGEGLQGLTAPFLEAGASSVVATLWQIGDRNAAQFIGLLYEELATGVPVGDALHRAKLRARAANMSPAVWSAFTITGDGRVRTALRPSPALPFAWLAIGLLVLGGAAYFVWRTISRRNTERR